MIEVGAAEAEGPSLTGEEDPRLRAELLVTLATDRGAVRDEDLQIVRLLLHGFNPLGRPSPALPGSSPRGGPPCAPGPAHGSGRGPSRGRRARPRGRSTGRRRRRSCGRGTAGRSSGRSRRRRGWLPSSASASIGQARTGTPRPRASSSSRCSSTRPTSVWPATAPVPPRRVAGFAPGIARSASRTGSPLQSEVVGTPYARASPFTRQWKTAAPAHALNAAGKTCAGPRGGRPSSPRTSARNAERQGRPARPAAAQRSRGHDHWWSIPKRTRRPARVASTSVPSRASRSVSRVKGPATLRGRPPRSSRQSAIARLCAEGEAAPL